MNRPFLFLAGEHQVSMPLVFKREHWGHTMSAQMLVEAGPRRLRRERCAWESLSGVLYFASVDDAAIRRSNLGLLIDKRFPCWPNPGRLYELDDRREVLHECVKAGFVDHPVVFTKNAGTIDLRRPFVLKTGNLHRGEGKHLIREGDALPELKERATAEPFFVGTSCRVLIVGDRWFGLRYDNPTTWIKNAAGADVEPWPDIPQAAVEHALRIHKHFGLEVSGSDYIIGAGNEVHFLEYNQFPGLGATEEIEEVARDFLSTKMDLVERLSMEAESATGAEPAC